MGGSEHFPATKEQEAMAVSNVILVFLWLLAAALICFNRTILLDVSIISSRGGTGGAGREQRNSSEDDDVVVSSSTWCSHYKSCASCTGARYFHHQRRESFAAASFLNGTSPWLKPTLRIERRRRRKQGFSSSTRNTSLQHHRSICYWDDHEQECHAKHHDLLQLLNLAKQRQQQQKWKWKAFFFPWLDEDSVDAMTMTTMDRYVEEEHYYDYESTCPLQPAYPSSPPEFLGDWISTLLNASTYFSSAPLAEFSLPGTHDSLSYDLSLVLSLDGIDDLPGFSEIFKEMSLILHPDEIEEFIRLQAQSQKLDVVQQLDNGIRFLDFRISFESKYVDKRNADWYSLHGLLSNSLAISYLESIKHWMEAHHGEILVIWLSRKGSTNDVGRMAYPNTDLEDKQRFWNMYMELFDGMLIDTSTSNFHSTGIGTLVERNHRLITFVSDYEEVTNNSVFAYDARFIQNDLIGGVYREEETYKKQREYFYTDRKQDEYFYLMGMNTAAQDWQVKLAFQEKFFPFIPFHSCSRLMNIPGNQLCPATLLEFAQLQNYYNQIVLSDVYATLNSNSTNNVHFPNAFYLDGLDYNGTIRVGTSTLEGHLRAGSLEKFRYVRYGVVDTIIAYNLIRSCNQESEMEKRKYCTDLLQKVNQRIAIYPGQTWQEPAFGRRNDWPILDSSWI